MVSHHFVMFGGHWPGAIRDVTHLICHVTSENHVIERFCDFVSGSSSSSLHVTTKPSLVAIDVDVVEM